LHISTSSPFFVVPLKHIPSFIKVMISGWTPTKGKSILVIVVGIIVVISLVTIALMGGTSKVGAQVIFPDYLIDLSRAGVYVYVSESALHYLNISKLQRLGLSVNVVSVDSLLNVERPAMLIISVSDVERYGPVNMLSKFLTLIGDGGSDAVVMLNPGRDEAKARLALEVVLKFWGAKGRALPLPTDPDITPIPQNKSTLPPLDKRIFKAFALAFTTNPLGFIVIENPGDMTYSILTIMKWGNMVKDSAALASIGRVVGEEGIVSIQGVTPIGYIGWLNAYMYGKVCNEVTGEMNVKIDIFYTATALPSGATYHAWFIHPVHSARGLQSVCQGKTYDHYPSKFNTTIDWRTWTWPGQVLDNWEPKNTGSAATISFTLTWSLGAQPGKQPSISLQYSPAITITQSATPYFRWWDYTAPAKGVHSVIHEVVVPPGISTSQLNGVTFTVEPSSVGFLDPTKPGGTLPMITCAYFTTYNNYGDVASLRLCLYLYPSSYYYYQQ
jgi:hypothetical protein